MTVSVQLGNQDGADGVQKKQSKEEEEMTTTKASSGYASIVHAPAAAASTAPSSSPYKDHPLPSEQEGETTRLLLPSQKQQQEEESLPFRRGSWCFVAAALISSIGLFAMSCRSRPPITISIIYPLLRVMNLSFIRTLSWEPDRRAFWRRRNWQPPFLPSRCCCSKPEPPVKRKCNTM